MTIASHVVEILRQGVWASLSGGWFYDPRHSTFCNTVHLYLWLILFALPLITAVCFDLTFVSIIVQCAIVFVLFAVLKLINFYLHDVFDTHEAIEQREESNSLDRSTFVVETSEQVNNPPLTVPSTSTAAVQPQVVSVDTRLNLLNRLESDFRIIDDEEEETEFSIKNSPLAGSFDKEKTSGSKSKDFAVEADVHHGCLNQQNESSNSSGSDIPLKPLLSKKKTENNEEQQVSLSKLFEVKSDSNMERTKKLRLNLEKNSTISRDDDDEDEEDEDERLAETTLSDDVFQRKFSEPEFNFPESSFGGRKKKKSKTDAGVRRTMSTVETRSDHREKSSSTLSEMMLQECRGKGVRKSYPGKTSSTDIFLLHARPPREAFDISNDSSSIGIEKIFASSARDIETSTSFADKVETEDEETSPSKLRDLASPSSARAPRAANQQMRVARFLSADLPLTDIPERESESEKFEEMSKRDVDAENVQRASATANEDSSNFSTLKSDVGSQRTNMTTSFYTASVDESPPPRTNDDSTSDAQKRQLIQSLRETLENLKSDSTNFGVELKAFNESSTPDLRWLFEEAQTDVDDEASFQDLTSPSLSAELRPRLPSITVHQHQFRERLMEEIKRLLEEIIDSHPEALEAIESVRQAKLASAGRLNKESVEELDDNADDDDQQPGPSNASTYVSKLNRGRRRLRHKRLPSETAPSSSRLNSTGSWSVGRLPADQVSDLTPKPGTHLATCHDDTTEGAVHCFQDEDGNWFSYTFSETGGNLGTAQSLGNERTASATLELLGQAAMSESSVMLHRQRPAPSSSLSHRGHRRTQSGGRRTSNSSSEESFFAEVPSSVLHPSIAAHVDRAERDSPQVVFGPPGSFVRFGGLRASTGSSYSTTAQRRRYPRPSLHLASVFGRTMYAGTTTSVGTSAAGNAASGSNAATTPGDYSSITLSSSQYPGISASVRTSSMGSGSSLNRIRFLTGLAGLAAGRRADDRQNEQRPAKRKQFYRVTLLPFFKKSSAKIRLDRLRLLALFDQNRTKVGAAFDAALAVLVAVTTCFLLKTALFADLSLICLCAVAAGAQFSLLKSVQPDAASPIHGFNWLVSYSRSVYFCLFGGGLIVLKHFAENKPAEQIKVTIYGVDFPSDYGAATLVGCLATTILILPVFFTLGLLPQLNTFAQHVLEQVDTLLLGGTPTFGLVSAIYSFCRSGLTLAVLFALCQLGLSQSDGVQSVVYSAFCGLLLSTCFALSRASSNPTPVWNLLVGWTKVANFRNRGEEFERKMATSEGDVNANTIVLNNSDARILTIRLKNDLLVSVILAVLTFALHCSTVFTKLQPGLYTIVPWITVAFGFVAHYVFPHLRKHTPFLLIAQPILRSHEHGMFDVDRQATLMWFERIYAWISFLERNFLYPIVVFNCLSVDAPTLKVRFDLLPAAALLTLASMKILRAAYCNVGEMYVPLGAACLLFKFDFAPSSQTLLIDFYVLSILYAKAKELLLKYQFIFAYVAPWQISWGSAFHAFAQPCAVPHSALTLAVGLLSSIISAPLNPFLGSAVFLMSYVRPVKFWEKDYNTKRVDHSNTRLASQLDRAPTTDDSNLNAIFYEHLTRSLQTSLAGDLALGRWSNSVCVGDCFVLASFYLNCLVHIVEVGNGFVSFQLRGLEFRGTYCQQREVEAISEEIGDGEGCFCYEPGHMPGFLSFNTAWSLRWLAWEVTAAKFVLEGYSVTDNSAVGLLQVFELRKLLVTLYVKCILYYAVRSPKLNEWLSSETVVGALEPIVKDERYVDVDPSFSNSNDEDYDFRLNGVSRQAFCGQYLSWIEYCVRRRANDGDAMQFGYAKDSLLTAFCYGLSLVGRRVLGVAAKGRHTSGAESFLYGLHALFKGDFRITCPRDEWVFADMDLLRCVVAPAVRMALKLHQDHFTAPDDYDDQSYLYRSITSYEETLFISHESDPAWRRAILANTPSLLALRHVFEDGQDDFKIIMLNKRHMNFRVIKLNKECVRAFWAGQQQELIFLRNRNPERGSIQNARQVLRNMINSSADQPIGYPIYVSPLTTSFVESHAQMASVTGPPFTLDVLWKSVRAGFRRLVENCGTSGSTNIFPMAATAREASISLEMGRLDAAVVVPQVATPERAPRSSSSTLPAQRQSSLPPMIQRSFTHPMRSGQQVRARLDESRSMSGERRRAPLNSFVSTVGKGTTPKVSLGSLVEQSKAPSTPRRQIKDVSMVFETLDKPLGALGQTPVVWPDDEWRRKGGRLGWKEWRPERGLEGSVVHRWTPSNPDHTRRSHMDKVILLLRVLDGKYYVPVAEAGVVNVGDEV